MRLTATKEFTFDCAHMLVGHEGLCKNLHGHTYKLEMEVQHFGSKDTIEGGPSDGMVIDFKDLKEIVNRRIVSKMDHAFICQRPEALKGAEFEISKVLESYGLKMYFMEDRPTAENMVKHIAAAISYELKGTQIILTRVRLYETPTSYAEFII